MKLRPTRFGPDRYGYAFEKIKESRSPRHLDIGCFDGSWISEVSKFIPAEFHGVDLNAEAVARGGKHSGIQIRHVQDISRLPYDSGSFGSISLMDVFEHLDAEQQSAVLSEALRLLSPRGIFIVTVPGEHLFSFLDIGNFKFRFPRLHRFFVIKTRGKEFYDFHFVNNPHGLVGDISAKKRWHEHFTAERLSDILTSHGFEVADVDGAGFFMRPVMLASLVPSKSFRKLVSKIVSADYRLFSSANVFVTVTRS